MPIYSFAIITIINMITKNNSKEYFCTTLKGLWIMLAFDHRKHTAYSLRTFQESNMKAFLKDVPRKPFYYIGLIRSL